MARAFESIASSLIHLARHAPIIVADMADRVHRYVMGLDRYLINGFMAVTLQLGMDIARVQAYAQG